MDTSWMDSTNWLDTVSPIDYDTSGYDPSWAYNYEGTYLDPNMPSYDPSWTDSISNFWGSLINGNTMSTGANALLQSLTGGSNPSGLANLLTGAGGIAASVMGSQAQQQAAREAIAAQLAMFNQTQANLQPWLQSGTNALNAMNNPAVLNNMASLNLPTTPTLNSNAGQKQFNYNPNDFYNSPMYKALLQSGTNAIDASAAAKGNFGSGNQLAELQKLGMTLGAQYQNQDYTQQAGINQMNNATNLTNAQYGNTAAQQAYQNALQQATTGYDAANANANQLWNRLASMAGSGQVTGQNIGSLGANATANANAFGVGGANAAATGYGNIASMFGGMLQ